MPTTETASERCACSATVHHGLFEAVADGPLEVTEVAQRVNASERGVRLLLEALEPLGYVSRHGDRFAATPMTEKWLLGHGHYAVEFCRRHTNLLATIFDLQPALATARQTIAQERMESRISTLEGDLQADDLGGPYDVVLD